MKNLFEYTFINDREEAVNYLNNKSFKRVLDVGYSGNNWSSKFTTHYIDINQSDPNKIFFKGDANLPFIWAEIEKDVELNGKFDFSVCTHTLEDLINPYYICIMLEKYSNEGFIAVPSKYQELTRKEGLYRGYIHHRYIFNKENDDFIAYPKLNFIDFDNRFDKISSQLNSQNRELQFFWKDKIDLKIINNNYMGPSVGHVKSYYNSLLN